ncbi:MAG: AsmA-like C-terminal domain-containing protein [Proteobacteria bacterium]|nr:AsmA-like C-terminal domain-containing protein [Pseudomonadota bacterium]MBU1714075.1 AsmA-like C-terminal domain-containing protein [Pseudomonadota bacterium]
MSKIIKFSIIFLLALCGLVLIGPKILQIEKIKSEMINKVTDQTGLRIEAARLSWSWFPLPHFSMFSASISNEAIDLQLPETRIYPHWRYLFDQTVELGQINFISPHANIKSLIFTGKAISLPEAKINITGGTLSIAPGLLPERIEQDAITLSAINAEIMTNPKWANLKLSYQTPFIKKSEIQGHFDVDSNTCQLNFTINQLLLQKAIKARSDEKISLAATELDLKGHIDIQGRDSIKATVNGDFPCFIIEPRDRKVLLQCGTVNFSFEKSGQDLTLEIKNLAVKTPGANISGRIARKFDQTPQNSTAAPEIENNPTWIIELAGKDLDLSQIRTDLLTLWGEEKIVQTVSDIVLGGKASRANFFFQGPASDFNHLNKMIIKVDVKEAEIDIPHTNLHLTEASGPIKILDGNLSGVGLNAKIGESLGKSCSLFLDLTGKNDAFMLDLDLDVNLLTLQNILHNLVKFKPFQDELTGIKNLEGRAKGHLYLGDKLHDLAWDVKVEEMKGQATDKHISWPIEITGGELDVSPTSVIWRRIKGNTGPHQINDFSGGIEWGKDPVLKIDQLEATFDSAALLSELNSNSALPKDFSKVLITTAGPLKINNATFSGPPRKPEEWTYNFNLSTQDLKWTSRLFPYPVFTRKASATVTDQEISLVDSNSTTVKQSIEINGNLNHKHLNDWSGWLNFNGLVNEDLARWIKGKEWIPAEYFPRIPCTLEDLKVSWGNGASTVAGNILAGPGNEKATRVELDLNTSSNHIVLRKLNIVSTKERGSLSLDYWNIFPQSLFLSWQGFLTSDTMNELLANNLMQNGKLEGDFKLNLTDHPASTRLTGWVKAENVRWPWKGHQLQIKNLNLDGKPNKVLGINTLELARDAESYEITGDVTTSNDGIKLDLNINSENSSWQSIKRLLSDLKGQDPGITVEEETIRNADQDKSPWVTTGRIAFTGKNFSSAPTTDQPDLSAELEPGPDFLWSTIDGQLNLYPQEKYAITINNSKLCGIDVAGTYSSDSSIGENSFNLFTRSEAPPFFQDILPCLGVKQSVIEGALHLDAEIKGIDNQWQEGRVDIYSFEGHIQKMSLLSKVFTVINLADLFSSSFLPDMKEEGFKYSKLDIKSHIKNNNLVIDQAIINGKGLNLFGRGKINLVEATTDITMLVAPLKTIDSIISSVPIIGRVIGGKDATLIAIPVGIKGALKDPEITVLPAKAIGESIIHLVTGTLKLPFTILSPILPDGKDKTEGL